MSSKRYPEEFKIEAVKQVTDRGHAVADVASRLGWRRAFKNDQLCALNFDQGRAG